LLDLDGQHELAAWEAADFLQRNSLPVRLVDLRAHPPSPVVGENGCGSMIVPTANVGLYRQERAKLQRLIHCGPA
jgi:hypothetical protein